MEEITAERLTNETNDLQQQKSPTKIFTDG